MRATVCWMLWGWLAKEIIQVFIKTRKSKRFERRLWIAVIVIPESMYLIFFTNYKLVVWK